METAKSVVGVTSIFFTIIVFFQSCAATFRGGEVEAAANTGKIGALMALLMLVAGTEAIASRGNKGRGIISLILFTLAGLLGLSARSGYLLPWAGLCLVFAAFFLVVVVSQKKQEGRGPEKGHRA
jgi:NADH:ubiquinone oxidoreductase subunit 2 (subunit N)